MAAQFYMALINFARSGAEGPSDSAGLDDLLQIAGVGKVHTFFAADARPRGEPPSRNILLFEIDGCDTATVIERLEARLTAAMTAAAITGSVGVTWVPLSTDRAAPCAIRHP